MKWKFGILKIPSRVYWATQEAKIETVEQLLQYTELEFSCLKLIGPTGFQETINELRRLNLKFKQRAPAA